MLNDHSHGYVLPKESTVLRSSAILLASWKTIGSCVIHVSLLELDEESYFNGVKPCEIIIMAQL